MFLQFYNNLQVHFPPELFYITYYGYNETALHFPFLSFHELFYVINSIVYKILVLLLLLGQALLTHPYT